MKNKLLFIVTGWLGSLFSLSALAQTETYQWSNVAIGGGGFVSGIITSRTEQNLLYARTDVGGAYRWNEANSKWIPLLDWASENELGYMGVESIAIDPKEANKVYMLVGTSYFNNGKTAILRSTDCGATFAITDVTSQFKAHGNGMGRQTGEKLMVDPNSNTILFCGTRANGLFKSINSGVSWSRLSGLPVTTTANENGISFVVLDPSTGTNGNATQTLIAGISQTGTNLYRSDDGGTTFTAIAGAPSALMPHRAVLASDRNLYITYANAAGPWDITGAGQIWKYNLQTSAWTNVTPASFAGAFGGISVDPNNANRLVTSSVNTYQLQDNSYGDRIFLSTNGGTSWTDVVARGFDLDPNGVSWVDGQAIHWAGSVEFDPFNTKKAWVISGNGVFSTNDIDATTNVWKFNVKGLEETVPLDIVSIPNGPLVSVIGDYDGFRHTDVTQYAPIHTPRMGSTSGIAFAAKDPNVMLRVGDKMYYSLDIGITWTLVTAKGTKGSVAISADATTFLHCADGATKTYKSIDKGTTWTEVTGLAIASSRPTADPVNQNKFYAYNPANGSVLVSNDKGTSFTAAGSAGSGGSKVIRVTPDKEGDVWIALNGGGLTRSVNSGQVFTKLNGVTYCGAVGFGKEAPGKSYPTVYIWGTVNSVLGIHRSIDEGATWKRVNDDAHEYGGPANGQFVIGDRNVFGRVYMSTAGRGIVYGETDQTCIPASVTPQIKTNDGAMKKTSTTTLTEGGTAVLSPEEISGGTWSWTGPNNFTSSSREVTLSNIQVSQGGTYTLRYTNSNGCQSALQNFTINVSVSVTKAQGLLIKSENDSKVIDTKNGTLQLTVVFTPANTTDQTVTWTTSNNDLALISAAGQLIAFKDGIVTAKAVANDGSGVSAEFIVTISNQLVTAIEESKSAAFEIYPNPASSEVRINHAQEIKLIAIVDVRGRTWKTMTNESETAIIPLGNMNAGIYILQLIDSERKKYNRRLVKL